MKESKEHKELCCRDVGVDCDFTARGGTIQEVVDRCAEHAIAAHGWKGFGPELFGRMRAHIRTVQEDPR